jgi:hypothetical protein
MCLIFYTLTLKKDNKTILFFFNYEVDQAIFFVNPLKIVALKNV